MRYRWFKELSHADAQHPQGANTNPTGHLTLVQAGHPINSATWFREALFGGLSWSGPSTKERLTQAMQITIDGKSMGVHKIDISHTPSFEANQGNRATVLHWGVLGHYMHQKDRSGCVVTIERDHADAFFLTICGRANGPAIV